MLRRPRRQGGDSTFKRNRTNFRPSQLEASRSLFQGHFSKARRKHTSPNLRFRLTRLLLLLHLLLCRATIFTTQPFALPAVAVMICRSRVAPYWLTCVTQCRKTATTARERPPGRRSMALLPSLLKLLCYSWHVYFGHEYKGALLGPSGS